MVVILSPVRTTLVRNGHVMNAVCIAGQNIQQLFTNIQTVDSEIDPIHVEAEPESNPFICKICLI